MKMETVAVISNIIVVTLVYDMYDEESKAETELFPTEEDAVKYARRKQLEFCEKKGMEDLAYPHSYDETCTQFDKIEGVTKERYLTEDANFNRMFVYIKAKRLAF